MQVASHPKTGWKIAQMTNKSFENNDKVATNKNEAEFHLVCFSFT